MMARFRVKSVICFASILLLFYVVGILGDDECENLDHRPNNHGDRICNGDGISQPRHNRVYFASSSNAELSLTWEDGTSCSGGYDEYYKLYYRTPAGSNWQSKSANRESVKLAVSVDGTYSLQVYHYCQSGSKQNQKCWKDSEYEEERCTIKPVVCMAPTLLSLVSPSNGNTFAGTSAITLRWDSFSSSVSSCNSGYDSFSYEVAIFKSTPNNHIKTITVNGQSSNQYQISDIDLNGYDTYYWTVRAYRRAPNNRDLGGRDAYGPYNNKQSFIYCAANTDPEKPELTIPSNNTVLEFVPGNVNIGFQWSHSNWGTTCGTMSKLYILKLQQSSNYLSLAVGTQTTYNYASSMNAGKWEWKIEASNGPKSSTSYSGYFDICFLTPPSSFSLKFPPNNDNGKVIHTNVTFEWNPSSNTIACRSSQVQYELFVKKQNSGSYFSIGKTTATKIENVDLGEPGTYFWKVIALVDGYSTESPVYTFVTYEYICDPQDPSEPELKAPRLSYVTANLVSVVFEWFPINYGVSCSGAMMKRSTDSLVLQYQNILGGSPVTAPLGILDTSYTVNLSPGKYDYTLTATNQDGKSNSISSSIDICDIASVVEFATNFSPAAGEVFLSSLPDLQWTYNTIPSNCAGTPTYSLSIYNEGTSLFETITTNSKDISSLSEGSWNWKLIADFSSFSVNGIPSQEYVLDFHYCEPSNPLSTTLVFPPLTWQFNENQAELTWRLDANSWGYDYCWHLEELNHLQIQKLFQVYIGSRSSELELLESCSTSFDDAESEYSCTISNLPAGPLFWRVDAIKRIYLDGSNVLNLTSSSNNGLFNVCAGKLPIATSIVSPANNVALQRCDTHMVFSWVALNLTDFGESCLGFFPAFELRIGKTLDTNDLVLNHFHELTSSDFIDLTQLQPMTTYYWKIVTFNGQFSASTPIQTFTTGPYNEEECSGNGVCSNGGCACKVNFSGKLCEVNDKGDNSSQDGPQGLSAGANIGIGVGIAIALLLIFIMLIVFIVFTRKTRSHKELVNLLAKKPPPDFRDYAFTPLLYPAPQKDQEASWKGFEQLIVATGFPLIQCMLDELDLSDADEIIKATVYVCESHVAANHFIRLLVDREIAEKKRTNQLNGQTIFRENSLASKGFKFYAKALCLPYLFHTLSDAVWDICVDHSPILKEKNTVKKNLSLNRRKSTESNLGLSDVVVTFRKGESAHSKFAESMETDPTKLAEGEDANVNAIALQLETQSLLLRVFKSVAIMPMPFRESLAHIMDVVSKNLQKEDGYIAVGSFIFLRLINPAILFPSQYALVEELANDPALTRHLVLITKILQNLANGVKFGKKETYMESLNSFIDDNGAKLRTFIEEVVDLNLYHYDMAVEDPIHFTIQVPPKVVDMSLMHLYAYAYTRQDKIIERFGNYCHNSEPTRRLLVNRFLACINELGEPQRPLPKS